MKLITLISGLLFIPISVSAQAPNTENPEKPPITEQKISVITLGTPPIPKFEIKDGKRHLKDITNNGQFPPQVLYRKEGKKMNPIPMALNVANQPFSHKANTALPLSRRVGAGEEASYRPFVTIPAISDIEQLTVLITRKTPTASWFIQPNTTILKNDTKSFPLKSVRVVNLSTRRVAVFCNKKWQEISPRRTAVFSIPATEKHLMYHAMYLNKKGEKQMLARNQAMRILPEDRANLVFYDNDGPLKKSRPVRLLSYLEARPINIDKRPQLANPEPANPPATQTTSQSNTP